MTKDQLQKLYADLKRNHLSVAEMSIIAVLLLDGPLTLSAVVRTVVFELQGDELEQPTQSYAQAVETCLSKKWIGKLTRQECKELVALYNNETVPSVDDGIVGSAGQIDITPGGYKVFRKAAKMRYPRSGRRCMSSELRLEIYGDSKAACLERAGWAPEIYPFNGNKPEDTIYGILQSVSEPAVVGPWRFNRFEVVSHGFLIVFTYIPK